MEIIQTIENMHSLLNFLKYIKYIQCVWYYHTVSVPGKESTWSSGHRHTMNANWQKGKSHLILEIMFFFFNDTIGKSVVEKSGLKTLKFVCI